VKYTLGAVMASAVERLLHTPKHAPNITVALEIPKAAKNSFLIMVIHFWNLL
jgi:hypothetical protein